MLPTNSCTIYSDSIITDTLNWATINFEFLADSNYTYIYLGNFFDAQNTDTLYSTGQGAYYYIDDVCLSTDSNYCETILSIGQNSETNFSIYPNPSHQTLNIDVGDAHRNAYQITIKIFTVDGKCLLTKNYKKMENISFDISTFAMGNYFIEISIDDSRMVKKFIKK